MLKKLQSLLSIISLAGLTLSSVAVGRDAKSVRAEAPSPSTVAVPAENRSGELKRAAYGQTSLLFEQNQGQTDREAKFVARGTGYTLYLADREAVFRLRIADFGFRNEPEKQKNEDQRAKTESDVLKMRFLGANTEPTIEGEAEAVTKTNYYTGRKRFENIPNYGRVNYKNLYDGIDAVFYGNDAKQLEYDFRIAPNADANQIKLDFDGAENISIADDGSLHIKTARTGITQPKPFAYQIIDGEKREVASRYVIDPKSEIRNPKSEIRFALGDYDRSQPLVIDPALKYLTYVGDSGDEGVDDVAADASGNAFLTGTTDSLNFHGQTRAAGDGDAMYVAKLDGAGQNILYLTILESSNDDGIIFGTSLAIDATGNVYVTGATDGRDYPTTANAFQPNKSICHVTDCGYNAEIVLTKLNPSGAIVYSTYFGAPGADFARDIAVDSQGRAYLAGKTSSGTLFPKKNEFQSTGFFGVGYDAFLTVFTADGGDIIYSTGLGGNSSDEASGIAIDANNNAYITGETGSNGTFPVRNAFQTANAGGKDAFVAKFNPALSGDASLVYSTFLGGGGTDFGNAIAVNAANQAVVTGVTGSVNFPLQGAFDTTNQVNEAFVTVLNSSGGNIVNSSFLGGSAEDEGHDIKLGPNGLIYVSGCTTSNNFPLALPFQATRRGLNDAFIAKLRFGSGVLSSSYLGGSDQEFSFNRLFVKGNNIYLVGNTLSNNLATTAGVLKSSFGGGVSDGFVAKLLDSKIDSVGTFRPNTTFTLTQSITNIVPQTAPFTTALSGAKGVAGDWDGDGVATIGSFTDGAWKFRDVNFPGRGVTPTSFIFGQAGDLPVVGDWNNDGIDTAGVFRPSTGQFLLTNATAGNPQTIDITINFGTNGDLPVAGDWNADGFDSVGVFRPSAGQFFLTDDNVLAATIDQVFNFGSNGDLPTAGDWNGDGRDTIGVWRPATTEFFLTNDHLTFSNVFTFGQANTDQPIAGDWDGIPN